MYPHPVAIRVLIACYYTLLLLLVPFASVICKHAIAIAVIAIAIAIAIAVAIACATYNCYRSFCSSGGRLVVETKWEVLHFIQQANCFSLITT